MDPYSCLNGIKNWSLTVYCGLVVVILVLNFSFFNDFSYIKGIVKEVYETKREVKKEIISRVAKTALYFRHNCNRGL